jgi:ABC-type uncharacterized transport system permease subunit
MRNLIKKLENLLNKYKGKLAFIVLASGILTIISLYSIITVPLHAKVWAMNTFNLAPMPERVIKDVLPELSAKEKIWSMLENSKLTVDQRLKVMEVIKCESGFNQYAIGLNKNGSLDLGVAQWNEAWHKLDRSCAFSVECSINKMIDTYLKEGNLNKWICSKKI